jgi:D-alanyl-D-alanine dipeptidase
MLIFLTNTIDAFPRLFSPFTNHMKTLSNLLPALAVLLAGLGVISCTQEESVKPTGTDPRNARVSADVILNPAVRLLTGQDQIAIARTADGVMTKVTYSPQQYVLYKTEVGQDPALTRTTAVMYVGGVKTRQTLYNNKGGKTYHSVTVYFDPKTGAVMKTVHHAYEYNGQGKVVRRYNVSAVHDRTQFAYNLAGDLSRMEEYTPQGVLVKTTRFYYNLNAPADKYGFYPDSPAVDPFLRVLGGFAKKLPTSAFIDYANPATADASLGYQYTLDAEGYPTRRDTHHQGSVIDVRTYAYKQYN